ncbi:hypothetical protein JAAARDRAFT_189502 [Jaapia argillacea MUCL 33604]|uniref:Phosphoglycerate mutase-like protein n=1 Tax=Jaapia argillacea MUCL 33604 TaxID=933084 RepID=A0A067Q501_9AGAM|nr:hypothetical protein JAAARDRAFT_189502 [Jaapia argillacea MUCL 33604]
MLSIWILLGTLVADTLALPYSSEITHQARSNLPIPHNRRQIIEGPGGYHFNVLEHLTGIGPYFDAPGVQLNPSPPSQCVVSKATYLVRHSNIYANAFDYKTFLGPFLQKLGNVTDKSIFSKSSNLTFLANYTSPVTNTTEQIEKMTPSGGQAAKAFGGVIRNLYPNLLQPTNNGSFRVWSASASRDMDTTRAFIEGLSNGAQLVEVYEGENDSADSLTPHESCPNFDSSLGSVQSGAWQKKYTAPIIDRFHLDVPGFNFTASDIVAMQELCGYDTVINNHSDFCNLFSPQEWLEFEYANDLMYFYSIGYGNPIAPQLGLPWVRSSLDILESANQISSTFNQSLYISFTHREEPPLILTALGLFNNSGYYPTVDVNTTMPSTEINYSREWKTSQILPFLGHVGIERLDCVNRTSRLQESFVRVLVNSAPIPIPGCQDGPGESCGLAAFGDYIGERIKLYGDFIGACGINGTVANRTDLLSICDA